MPLTDEIATEAKHQYIREYDRYVKLASYISSKCESLIRDAGIPAVVQHRAKKPDSFYKKLSKYIEESNQEKISRVSKPMDALEMIGDLAAVRVATYVEGDRQRVVELICSHFKGPTGSGSVDVDQKEKVNGYRATHCQVLLPDEMEISPDAFNVRDTSAEIQVCSMLAHVWNEIEHDIRYKISASWGDDAPFRDQLLEEFHDAIEIGDSKIETLLGLASEKTATSMKEDLRDITRELGSFDENAHAVLREVARLGYNIGRIRLELMSEGWVERGRQLIKDINYKFDVEKIGADLKLNLHNADVLLAILLKEHLSDINALYKRNSSTSRASEIANLIKTLGIFEESRPESGKIQ